MDVSPEAIPAIRDGRGWWICDCGAWFDGKYTYTVDYDKYDRVVYRKIKNYHKCLDSMDYIQKKIDDYD